MERLHELVFSTNSTMAAATTATEGGREEMAAEAAAAVATSLAIAAEQGLEDDSCSDPLHQIAQVVNPHRIDPSRLLALM